MARFFEKLKPPVKNTFACLKCDCFIWRDNDEISDSEQSCQTKSHFLEL